MFWLGILAALFAGLLSLSSARAAISRRYPETGDFEIDVVAAALLAAGLCLAGYQHTRGVPLEARSAIEAEAAAPILRYAGNTMASRSSDATVVVTISFARLRAEPLGRTSFTTQIDGGGAIRSLTLSGAANNIETMIAPDTHSATITCSMAKDELPSLVLTVSGGTQVRMSGTRLEPATIALP